MNFEEQPVATTCDMCRYIAEQVPGAVTAVDAFEGAVRSRDRRIAELEAQLADRGRIAELAERTGRAVRWHGADDIPQDPKPSTMSCPSCGEVIPGMRDALVELAKRDSQLGQYDAALTAARARVAELEAERDRLREALEGLLCLTPSTYERHFEKIHRQIRSALAAGTEEQP